ncbi:MAG TPA: papain-like cysteine protease family protein [Gemmatimonadales bacterium]
MRGLARLVAAGLGFLTGLGSAAVALAQPPPSDPQQQPPPAVLDVPYLPQSVLLCGGAALAMVERWWGRRAVYAEDFAALVQPARGGILTTDLARTARARGWDTWDGPGTPELVRQSLDHGAPVVALIRVAPERYHYVVVIGWTANRVVFHDPAGAPHTTLDENTFMTRWTGANHWAMVARPMPPVPAVAGADSTQPARLDSMACSPWIDRALDAVAAGQLEDALQRLDRARAACPDEPLVLREMAGVRFKQGRQPEAIQLVTDYLTLAPGDEHGWQLLAASRYLSGDHDGALTAWNRLGRPVIDLVRIDGVRATRFGEIADAMSVPHGTVLTPSRLALARRRVSDVPALRWAAVEYQPVPGGIVEIRAAVTERPRMEPLWRLAAAGALRAIAQNEVGLDVATPTGAGELWSVGWRWQYARPRAFLRLALPADLGIPGVVSVGGVVEQFRFVLDTTQGEVFEESRRSANAGFGAWVTSGVRPSAALRFERWSGDRRYLVASANVEMRGRDDRLVFTATGGHAVALSTHPSYTRAGVGAVWVSSQGLGRRTWSTRLGADWASADAPVGTWPVAAGNLSWAIPLRADPVTGRGLLPGRSVGRAIIHGGLAGDQPVYRAGLFVLAAGVFLDGAEIMEAADGSPGGRLYLDAGAGIRIGIADGQLGVLRVDFAKGLMEGGRSALTIGVHRSWPPYDRGVRQDNAP